MNQQVEDLRLDRNGRPASQLLSRDIDLELTKTKIQISPRPKGRISSTASRVLVCRGGVPVQRLLYHSQGIATKSSGKFRAAPPARLQVCRAICAYAATNVLRPPLKSCSRLRRIHAEAGFQRIVTMAVSSNSTPQWRADDRRRSRQHDRQRPALGRSRQQPHHLESRATAT